MFEKKLKEIRQRLIKEKLDAVLVSSVSNIIYLSGYDNFSDKEREAYIFLGSDFAYIITDGRYTEAVKKQVPHLTLFERSHKNPTKNLFKKHQKEIKRLGIEEDNLTVVEHKSLKKHFKNIKNFEVSHLRSIKTEDEISKIEKACRVGDLAFDHILKKITDGITEKWLAGELEKFIKEKGGEFSFPPIVAFGKNSSVPHHQTGDTKLTDEEFTAKQEACFILLDFGVKINGYCSDMTRTIFFGKPSDKQKEIYQTVLAAQQKSVDCINLTIKAGKQVKAAKVDQAARDYIVSKGYPIIPHSLGHGIGLEVHERPSLSPRSKEDLKEGMVFSIEPGIYLENVGGIRIEDLFVLKKQGLRQLTSSPKKLIII